MLIPVTITNPISKMDSICHSLYASPRFDNVPTWKYARKDIGRKCHSASHYMSRLLNGGRRVPKRDWIANEGPKVSSASLSARPGRQATTNGIKHRVDCAARRWSYGTFALLKRRRRARPRTDPASEQQGSRPFFVASGPRGAAAAVEKTNRIGLWVNCRQWLDPVDGWESTLDGRAIACRLRTSHVS
jgi:hypothetical protein